jgi:hypothetical protein
VPNRYPVPGERAEILLVDLHTGDIVKAADTFGFDSQLGAQVQWGATDSELFYNDMDVKNWTPFFVRMNPLDGSSERFTGSVFSVSRDGTKVISPCLKRTALTQPGYGVIVPPSQIPHNSEADEDDGIHITYTKTGAHKLLVSYRGIYEALCGYFDDARYRGGSFYGFQVSWNPQGTRIKLALRYRYHKVRHYLSMPCDIITMDAEGGDIKLALPSALRKYGGHHANWYADGEYISQNLNINGEGMRFVKFKYDGTGLETIVEKIQGSGHPTVHANGKYILTDANWGGGGNDFLDRYGNTPIRLIDIDNCTERSIISMDTKPRNSGPEDTVRVDAHPAFDRNYASVVLNGCPKGIRGVYLADLSEFK